jgi:hypothetical protein
MLLKRYKNLAYSLRKLNIKLGNFFKESIFHQQETHTIINNKAGKEKINFHLLAQINGYFLKSVREF